MLDDFGNELESTESKIDSTMKKMAKVLHMNNGNFFDIFTKLDGTLTPLIFPHSNFR